LTRREKSTNPINDARGEAKGYKLTKEKGMTDRVKRTADVEGDDITLESLIQGAINQI
jgi:hypothetical protein